MTPTPFDAALTLLDLDREILRHRQRLYRYLCDKLDTSARNAEYISRYLVFNMGAFTPMEATRITSMIKIIEEAQQKRLHTA